mmetsp:Transcript_9295/g.30769  ORF Transcript_9295/g.30769 Transcript_9295/m.30769 type:complete len:118 (-) Transcript_9295:88-441(-)
MRVGGVMEGRALPPGYRTDTHFELLSPQRLPPRLDPIPLIRIERVFLIIAAGPRHRLSHSRTLSLAWARLIIGRTRFSLFRAHAAVFIYKRLFPLLPVGMLRDRPSGPHLQLPPVSR